MNQNSVLLFTSIIKLCPAQGVCFTTTKHKNKKERENIGQHFTWQYTNSSYWFEKIWGVFCSYPYDYPGSGSQDEVIIQRSWNFCNKINWLISQQEGADAYLYLLKGTIASICVSSPPARSINLSFGHSRLKFIEVNSIVFHDVELPEP